MAGDDPGDLGALHRWLSLEEWFTAAEAARGLTVVYREGDGTEREAHQAGPPMGGGIVELVLVIVGAALSPAFDDLYRHAKVAVRAWQDNISSGGRRVDAEVRAEGEGTGGAAIDTATGTATATGTGTGTDIATSSGSADGAPGSGGPGPADASPDADTEDSEGGRAR